MLVERVSKAWETFQDDQNSWDPGRDYGNTTKDPWAARDRCKVSRTVKLSNEEVSKSAGLRRLWRGEGKEVKGNDLKTRMGLASRTRLQRQ